MITWQNRFLLLLPGALTASFMTRPSDRFRVVSSRDNNSITWTCVGDNQTSNGCSIPRAGEAIEFGIPANHFCRFVSLFPVLLVQFSVGGNPSRFADPSMTLIPPIDQYKSSYMLNYFPGFSVSNFANVILLTTAGITTGGTLLDGSTLSGNWTEIYCENGDCAYGVQVGVENTANVVNLSHTNPDAHPRIQLMSEQAVQHLLG